MKSLGERVREFREDPARNWSTTELADKVGTSRQNIENLERGDVALPKYVVALARVMGLSVDALLGRRSERIDSQLGVRETTASYNLTSIESALTALGQALADLPEAVRPAVADNLHGWARDGGADHYRGVLLHLFQAQPKKRRA